MGAQDVWDIVEKGYVAINLNADGVTEAQKQEERENKMKDKGAMFLLYQAVMGDENGFEKISDAKTAKEAWDALERAYKSGSLNFFICVFICYFPLLSLFCRVRTLCSSATNDGISAPASPFSPSSSSSKSRFPERARHLERSAEIFLPFPLLITAWLPEKPREIILPML